jgi:hypothetical protein
MIFYKWNFWKCHKRIHILCILPLKAQSFSPICTRRTIHKLVPVLEQVRIEQHRHLLLASLVSFSVEVSAAYIPSRTLPIEHSIKKTPLSLQNHA